jgi:hypothetical protein
MGGLLAVVCIGVTVLIAAILARDVYLRKHDPLSWKHLFLVGFIVFFGTGGFFTVMNDVGSELYVATDRAKGILAAGIAAFLVVFLAFVAVGMRSRWVDKVVPRVEVPRTTPGVLICLFACLGLVLVSLAFPAGGESFVTALASFFRGGMAVTATGLATYWLLSQKFNPISWAVMGITLAVCLVASIFGESGRRQLLSVMLVIPWVWYYTALRYQPVRVWGLKAGVLLFGAFVLLVGYSGVRATLRDNDRSISALTSALMQSATSSDLSSNTLKRDLFYQDAATNSMYIIDSYGDMYRQEPFRGLYWFITNPIPRSIWPDKPVSLGGEISEQQRVIGNIAPGVIGHGWAEAGFIGILYYAAFLGFLVGAGDRLLQLRASNPFFVTLMGSSLGQVIAMSRGDTPLFLLNAAMTALFAMIVMYACKLVFNPIMAGFPRLRAGPDVEEALGGSAGEDGGPEGGDDGGPGSPDDPDRDGAWGEQDWGQASAAWEYSEHDAHEQAR